MSESMRDCLKKVQGQLKMVQDPLVLILIAEFVFGTALQLSDLHLAAATIAVLFAVVFLIVALAARLAARKVGLGLRIQALSVVLLILVFVLVLRPLLREKKAAELAEGVRRSETAAELPPPILPRIDMRPIDLLATPAGVTVRETKQFRDHLLRIVNNSLETLTSLEMTVRCPDGLVTVAVEDPGVADVRIEKTKANSTFRGEGSAAFQPDGRERTPLELSIAVAALPPARPVVIYVRSDVTSFEGRSYRNGLAVIGSPDMLPYFVRGRFQYQRRSGVVDQEFLVPLVYHPLSHEIVAGPAEPPPGRWKLSALISPGGGKLSTGTEPNSWAEVTPLVK